MLFDGFEVEERRAEALMDDLFHPRPLSFSQHVLPDQLLVNSHPTRRAPAAVVTTAVMIPLKRSAVCRLPLHFIAAVGGEENVKQIPLAALLTPRVPVENQRSKHGP